MAGADETLGQFVGQVLCLQRHLPGDIEGYGIGAVGVDDRAQAPGRLGDGGLQRATGWLLAALVTDESVGHAPDLQRHMGGQPLGAQAPEVAGVLLVAADLDHLAPLHVHDDAAPDPAIRANTAHFTAAHHDLLLTKRQRRRLPGLQVASGATRRLRRGERTIGVDGLDAVQTANPGPFHAGRGVAVRVGSPGVGRAPIWGAAHQRMASVELWLYDSHTFHI